MPTGSQEGGGRPSRRAFLRLAGGLGLAGAGLATSGCSAADREALRSVDPARVRIDAPDPPAEQPPPTSERELRRRAVRAGSVAALAALGAAGDPSPAGRTGGAAAAGATLDVHRVHAGVLVGVTAPSAGSPSAPASAPVSASAAPPSPSSAGPSTPAPSSVPSAAPVPTPGAGAPAGLLPSPAAGPTLAPGGRPGAVLATGAATAVRACLDEAAEPEPQPGLALLHARVAAARTAQATGLRAAAGAAAPAPAWPGSPVGAGVVDALQALLAHEHRTAWSAAVVLAWATDRSADAALLRRDADARAELLAERVRLLGAEPVGARATYPTDDAGRPVDGPGSATALALRLADGEARAAGGLLVAAVAAGDAAWVRAAVDRLAEAERGRWSWGGAPVPWPGS